MRGFKSARHAQRFLSIFGMIADLFSVGRHLLSAVNYREALDRRFVQWRELTGVSRLRDPNGRGRLASARFRQLDSAPAFHQKKAPRPRGAVTCWRCCESAANPSLSKQFPVTGKNTGKIRALEAGEARANPRKPLWGRCSALVQTQLRNLEQGIDKVVSGNMTQGLLLAGWLSFQRHLRVNARLTTLDPDCLSSKGTTSDGLGVSVRPATLGYTSRKCDIQHGDSRRRKHMVFLPGGGKRGPHPQQLSSLPRISFSVRSQPRI